MSALVRIPDSSRHYGTSEKCQTRTCGWYWKDLRVPPSFQAFAKERAGLGSCTYSLGQSSRDERSPHSFSQFN